MSRPKPPPPPRPDLEEQSTTTDGQEYSLTAVTPSRITPPKSSKKLPPPIPLRPDLGEGIGDDVPVPSPLLLNKPPPVMGKNPQISKAQGRPEITIISAQPVRTPGIHSPTLDASIPSHPEQPLPDISSSPDKVDSSSPTKSTFISSIAESPVMLPPPPVTASGINKPVSLNSQPPSPSNIIDLVTPASTPVSEPIISPLRPSPSVPSKTNSTFPPSSSSTSSPSPTGNRVNRTPKNREPPQRPKSKPVCELPVEEEPVGSIGVMNSSVTDSQEDSPIAPKRKKNKANKGKASFPIDFGSSSGIDNSAFLENESRLQEDTDKQNIEVNKTPTPTKPKGFPTVIRTKPNGKDSHSTGGKQEEFQKLDNFKTQEETQAKTLKPTVIKAPQTAKKASPQNENMEVSIEVTQPVQHEATPASKPKSKPTVIIPKAKKDSGSKSEGAENKSKDKVVSPSNKPILEIKMDNVTDKKTSKTKRIPSIIRPNKIKKDMENSQGDNVEGFRGTPEGQSQENQGRKLEPLRKAPAPPRPGPPKSAPPRPAPPRPGPSKQAPSKESKTTVETASLCVKFEANPKAPAPSETKSEQVKGQAPEKKLRLKHPRPVTIGKDKESVEPKNTDIMKKKEEKTDKEIKQEEPILSSVVSTKIEPSAIALYDYIPTSMDDLSFKAGDEIFLIKRLNHEWYIGRCGDCEGMMPLQFVEIIEDLPPEQEPPSSYKASNSTAALLSTVALYHFEAQSNDELTLHAGDTVYLLEMVNDSWLKGQIDNKIGIFPTNFVEFNEDMKQKLKQTKSSEPTASNKLSQEILTKENSISSGPRCKALYDYDSGNQDDLSFNTGDVIQIVERINAEWLKGEKHGSTGMFPVAFVEIIEDLETASGKHVTTALHDYVAHAEGDLSFRKGDRITIIEKINEDWLEGELNGQKGMLPSTYVEHVELPGSTQLKKVPGHQLKSQDHLLPKGKALYDFTGEHQSELTFKAGDEIILLKHINDEWMEGEFYNHIGQFPAAFIEILVPLP